MSAIPQSVAYKESGIPWVGKIPEHWRICKFKYFAKVCNGKEQIEVVDENGQYLIYGSGGVIGRANGYLYDKTSVLLGRKGTIDKPLFVEEPFWTIDTMFYTRIFEIANPRFFFYLCLNIDFDRYASGSAIPSMTQSQLEDINFPLPPLQEQQAIADFLDKKTRQIEEFITKKQKLITLLEEKKQTLINQCVTQGLDPSTPLKDSGVEWIGKIPTHWEVRKLKYVVSLRNQKEGESDFRIGLENIESKTGRFIQADESAFDDEGIGFFEGDVLFGKLRPYLAKVFLADKNGICVSEFLVLKSEGILNRFLKFLMLSGVFIEVVNSSTYGTKMPRANWEFIGNLKIPILPLEEQKAIAEYLDTQIEKIDLAICKIKSQINLIKEYKTTLISEGVCGRIGVEGNV